MLRLAAPNLSRRATLLGLGGLGLGLLAPSRPAHAAVPAAEWTLFRRRFIQPDGRVLDTGNGGQSHSEGQGWGMLFAARFDDRETFNRIHAWTARVLTRPSDALHAWRCAPNTIRVDDLNNATDGDLLIAWALLEAARRWHDPALAEAGARLAADILRLLVREIGPHRVLVPGLRGFEHPDYLVVNPSYYVFPAFPALAAACPDPAWLDVAAHAIGMFRQSRFGTWNLPPDWLAISGRPGPGRPAPGWPSRFSFDAVRVPLYMIWAGLGAEPAVLGAARLWTDARHRTMPAWVDLNSGETPGYTAPSGIAAVARLTIATALGRGRATELPSVALATDYYSAALTLLTHLAWQDRGP